MPEISRFLGILIYMYYREHAPPHFQSMANLKSLSKLSQVSCQVAFRDGLSVLFLNGV